jgi:hypothetical protein
LPFFPWSDLDKWRKILKNNLICGTRADLLEQRKGEKSVLSQAGQVVVVKGVHVHTEGLTPVLVLV